MERRCPLLLRAACFFFLLLASPSFLCAAEFRLTSDTLLRAFERDIGGDEDTVVPIYEYLQADVGREGEQPLTFHLYGWGRVDLAGSDYFEERFGGGDDTAGELLYGYLQYDRPGTSLMVRLGRQYVFEGVTNDSIDGLRLATDLGDYFSASAYGGWPVALDSEEGRSGDGIFGGRVATHRRGLYELGLSYKHGENDSERVEERAGGDLALFLPAGTSLYGFSSYNLQSDGWAEHRYELRAGVGRLQIRPFFERYRYDDYFDSGDDFDRADIGSPFRFLAGLDETLTTFGADLLWQQSERWEWGLKGKYYDYDERDDSSHFYSATAVWHAEGLSQVGGELGRMDGDFDEGEYILGRTYAYWDRPAATLLKFVTGDVVYVWYDEDIHDEDSSLFLSVGTGTRLLSDALELKVAADYYSDPYFDDDLRGWLLARYALNL